ncbi:hypothetical protein KCU98_g18906, partial [Aureobasidium melanogenum]
MRFTSFAIAAFSLSLATAMPTKRAIVAPGNDGTGNGLIPGVGKTVDGVINAVENGIAVVVKGDDNSENSKRAIVFPFNNGKGEGLLPDVGDGVDTVINTVEDGVATVVKGEDATNAE